MHHLVTHVDEWGNFRAACGALVLPHDGVKGECCQECREASSTTAPVRASQAA